MIVLSLKFETENERTAQDIIKMAIETALVDPSSSITISMERPSEGKK